MTTGSIVRRKCLGKPDAIFQSFEQDTFGSVLLVWSNRSLDLSHLSPGDLIAYERRFELSEEIQPTRAIDQFRVRNRVLRAGNQVGEADVIAHLNRNHGQRRVEEAGYLPEEIAEQVLLGGLYTRSHTYRTSKVPSIPLSRWLGNGQSRLSQ